MSNEMYSCCKKQPFWIFIYKNNQVYTICKDHFESDAHRWNVQSVINFNTNENLTPEQAFGQILESVS